MTDEFKVFEFRDSDHEILVKFTVEDLQRVKQWISTLPLEANVDTDLFTTFLAGFEASAEGFNGECSILPTLETDKHLKKAFQAWRNNQPYDFYSIPKDDNDPTEN